MNKISLSKRVEGDSVRSVRSIKCLILAFCLLTMTACDQSIPASVILTENTEQTESEVGSETAVTAETNISDDAESTDPPSEKSEVRVVLVGDSRAYNLATIVCGLEENDTGIIIGPMGSDYVICAGGQSFDWMSDHEREIDEQAAENTAIVIGMGVNKCRPFKGETVDEFAERYSTQYADWLNKKAVLWESKGAKVWFCSVNPIGDQKAAAYGYEIRDEYVRRFNEAIIPKLNDNVRYIDTYSQVYDILASGKGTDDGLHYHGYVYEIIKDYIWQAVNEQ
ncbi:MAG: SGNH/GDSL hydrolase family protein [Ruminococcaceae bacterium]|nr:SGNH/GDSL hydrolase family protein [Oscillospiraceae bacterium]